MENKTHNEAKRKDSQFVKWILIFGFGAILFYALLVSRQSFTTAGKILAIAGAFAWSYLGNRVMESKGIAGKFSKWVLWGFAILFAILLLFVEPGK